MRTTLNIDDQLLEDAQRLTGIVEKTTLVREGLRALIERESARRLILFSLFSPFSLPFPPFFFPFYLLLPFFTSLSL